MTKEYSVDDEKIIDELVHEGELADEARKRAGKKDLKKFNKSGIIVMAIIGIAIAATFSVSFFDTEASVRSNGGGKTKVENVSTIDLSTDSNSQTQSLPKEAKIVKAAEAKEDKRIQEGKEKSEATVLKGIKGLNNHNWEKQETTKPNTDSLNPANKSREKLLKSNLSRLFSSNVDLLPDSVTKVDDFDPAFLESTADSVIEVAETEWETVTKIEKETNSELSDSSNSSSEYELVNDQSRASVSKDGATNTPASESNPKPKHGIKLNYGRRLYGLMHIEIDSDEVSHVIGKIYQSPLVGAELHGDYQVKDEYVIIRMRKMIFKGETYNVKIVAVDPETKRVAIADEVDTHPEKYFYFTLAALGEGWLKYNTAKTELINTDRSRVSQTDALSGSDLTEATLANVAERALPGAQQYLSVPNTIRVYDEREVLFYLEEDLEL